MTRFFILLTGSVLTWTAGELFEMAGVSAIESVGKTALYIGLSANLVALAMLVVHIVLSEIRWRRFKKKTTIAVERIATLPENERTVEKVRQLLNDIESKTP